MITIALSKGRIFDETVPLLRTAGITVSEDPEASRKLNAVRKGVRLRVATKYLQTAREHFAAKGVHADIIELYGSMEFAQLTGLAVEEIVQVSARLVINQAALKLKRQSIQPLLGAFARAAA